MNLEDQRVRQFPDIVETLLRPVSALHSRFPPVCGRHGPRAPSPQFLRASASMTTAVAVTPTLLRRNEFARPVIPRPLVAANRQAVQGAGECPRQSVPPKSSGVAAPYEAPSEQCCPGLPLIAAGVWLAKLRVACSTSPAQVFDSSPLRTCHDGLTTAVLGRAGSVSQIALARS